MAISLSEKQEIVAELKEKFDKNEWVLLASATGMTVAEISEFRNKLREKGVSLKVYKNTLLQRVISERTDAGELPKLIDHLKGSTMVAFTNEDPIVSAKMFADYVATNDKMGLKAAVYEKKYWSEADIKNYSKLGSKSAIYAQLIGALKGPMYKLIYVLQAPGGKLVGTLKAVAEKG